MHCLSKFPMMKMLSLFAACMLLLPLQTIQGAAADDAALAPKAIFIIVDGIPADVLEATDTPNLDDIAGDHGYTRSWVGGEIGGPSESPTISAVGYMSLITGTWANKHNVYDNEVEKPDYRYWDIFRIAKEHDSSLQTAIFSTWLDNRTKLVGDGLPEAGGHKLDYHFDGFELDTERFPHDSTSTYIRDIDEHVSKEAARYIETVGPDLSWVYLEFTDDVGHTFGDSPQQKDALKIMDGNLGMIWDAVRKRQASHDEDWLVIVTTDHGRDAKTGKEHGEQSERERTTWIVTNSQNLNDRFAKMPPVVDILPSIAWHLDLEIPATVSAQFDGQSFIE